MVNAIVLVGATVISEDARQRELSSASAVSFPTFALIDLSLKVSSHFAPMSSRPTNLSTTLPTCSTKTFVVVNCCLFS